MLIKLPDPHDASLVKLNTMLHSASDITKPLIEEQIRKVKAGKRAEEQTAYVLDGYYKTSHNFTLIHDFRFIQNGQYTQIDHIVIDRLLHCYVLESKSFRHGVKITEEGEFLTRTSSAEPFSPGRKSPLLQNDDHVEKLKLFMNSFDMPKRLGIRLKFSYFPFVVVPSETTIERPNNFDTSRFIRIDELIKRMDRDSNASGPLDMFKMVSQGTLNSLAKKIVEHHKPAPVPNYEHLKAS